MEWDGYNGGEIASKLATETVKNFIENNIRDILNDRNQALNIIRNAMEYANMVVYEKSKEHEELSGMGTTMEVCLILDDKMYIGHIGDSRIYRIRRGVMQRLTTDHSYVQELVKGGTITPKEAEHHPKKNMLMKALGCTPYAEPDILERSIQAGDIIEMNTDGLTNMVPIKEIQEIIEQEKDNIVHELIGRANGAGGLDNITTVIVKM